METQLKNQQKKTQKHQQQKKQLKKTGTATAAGYGGDIKLTVTMEGDKIKDIVVDEHSESEGIGADALPELVEAAKNANGTEFDNVSGATVTSEAFKAALKDAMDAAK